MKAIGLFLLLPALASAAPLSISAPPDAALTTPHRIGVLAEGLKVPWELRFLRDGQQIFTERIGSGLLSDKQIGIVADFIRSHRK